MYALSRRTIVTAAAALGLSLYGRPAGAQVAITPACDDGDDATPAQTEGPFFRPTSPRRDNLQETRAKGRVALLQATVVNRRCQPVAGAIVDIWHADETGAYDNAGFR